MPSIVKAKGDATEEADGGSHKQSVDETSGENENDKIIEEPSSGSGKKSPTPQEMEDVESVASFVEFLGEEEPPTKKAKTSDDAAVDVDVEDDKKKCHDEKEKSDQVVIVGVDEKDEKSGAESAEKCAGEKSTSKEEDKGGRSDELVDGASAGGSPKKSSSPSAKPPSPSVATARANQDGMPSSSSNQNKRKRNENDQQTDMNAMVDVTNAQQQQQFMAMQQSHLMAMEMHAAMLQNPMLMQQQMAMQQNPMLMQQMAMQNPQMMAMLHQQQMLMLQNNHPQVMAMLQQQQSNQVLQEQLQRLHNGMEQEQILNTFGHVKQNLNNSADQQSLAENDVAAGNNTAERGVRTEQLRELSNMLQIQRLIQAKKMVAANNRAEKPITVILILPPGKQIKLGMVLKDNKFTKLAELKWLADDSPIRNQLPKKYHMDCCIAEIKCRRIGGTVAPKSAKHCQELLGQCKDEKEETTVELVLVKIPPFAKIGQTERDREKERMTAKLKLATEERRQLQEKVTALEKQQKQPAQRKQEEEEQQQRLEPVKVILTIPSNESIKLGMILRDNHVYNLPELVHLSLDSPIQTQIDREYQRGCCIVSLKSHKIGGQVSIKSAKQFLELISKCRVVASETNKMNKRCVPVTVEMLMIQIPVKQSVAVRPPKADAGRQLSQLQSNQSSNEKEKKRKDHSETAGGKESPEPTSPSNREENDAKEEEEKECEMEEKDMRKAESPIQDEEGGNGGSAEHETSPAKIIDDSETSDKPSAKKPSPDKDEAHTGTPKKKNSHESVKEWNRQFDNLVRFKRSNGHFNVNPSVYPELALWVFEQRIYKSKLTKSRLRRLKSIDFPFYEKVSDGVTDATNLPNAPHPTPSWDERYESLSRFKSRCGFFPASGDLRDWLKRQKEEAAHLSSQRIKKLHELGVKLNLPRERLEQLGIRVGWETISMVGSFPSRPQNFQQQTKGGRTEDSGPKSELREQLNGIFWKSAEAAKMFGFSRGDDILKGLQERIDRLRKANESVDGWKTLVPNDGKEELYKQHDILKLRHKVQYLIKAYVVAKKQMNELNWMQCCKQSAEDLGELGLTKYDTKTIMHWNVGFRKDGLFQHPKKLVTTERVKPETKFQIFEYFPRAKDMFLEYANEINESENDELCGPVMKEHFDYTILPELERESREKGCFDDESREQKLLVKLLAAPPSLDLVTKWMKQLNIIWDKFASRRGKHSTLSKAMKNAWSSGKYSNRRPKGQGLKKGAKQVVGVEDDEMLLAAVQDAVEGEDEANLV